MAHAPSHRPRGVHQKPCRLSVSFHRPELAARLIDACLHELLRLLRPYGGLYALKPLKPWQHGPQHSLVQHLSRGGLPRRFGPLALELRLHGLPLRFPHLADRGFRAKGVLHPHIIARMSQGSNCNWTPAINWTRATLRFERPSTVTYMLAAEIRHFPATSLQRDTGH